MEAMRLAYNELLLQNPGLEQRLDVFSQDVCSAAKPIQHARIAGSVFLLCPYPVRTQKVNGRQITCKTARYLFDVVTGAIAEEHRHIF